VQACHALREFTEIHPEIDSTWYRASNHLAVLAVDHEASLMALAERARERGVQYAPFREPDAGNTLTAIALEPGPRTRRLCRGLRLALS